ncbi:MAG TPA: hypothetical protein EYP49_00945 [Anaerolineae bacterium]|nr:hypothetical protein [Anaerolineae bacterium]
MTMQASLKAGAVGAGVAVILALISLIPCAGCFTWILALLLYIGIGALAAYWLPPVRTAGSGAGAGALAGVIAAIIGGIVNMIIAAIRVAITGPRAMATQIPPDAMRPLAEMGIDPTIFMGFGGAMIFGSICCVIGLVIAAVLGAIGGIILAVVKPE